MGMTLTGPAATVRWVYHQAADLGAWTITDAENGTALSVTAVVKSSDAYRLAQRPVVFVVPRPTGVWRFPILELQIAGATLTASLGPQE